MKSQRLHFSGCALIALALFNVGQAQTVTTETTTSAVGTVTTVAPNSIIVRTETNATPLRYTFTKTTQYVDEAGSPVKFETVKSGLPVTVHYVKDGDQMLANRVVIRGGGATTTKTTFTAGTVTELSPGVLVVRTAQDPTPLRYTYTKTTRYVDETGTPVAIEQIKSGRPVTVHYEKAGDHFIAQRVVVHAAKPAAPPQVIEKRTTTTTTTEKPSTKKDDDDDDDDDD